MIMKNKQMLKLMVLLLFIVGGTEVNDDYVYYPDNVQDEKNIGYTKARSEGFTAEKNDNLVAIPPRRMANNGYLNPR